MRHQHINTWSTLAKHSFQPSVKTGINAVAAKLKELHPRRNHLVDEDLTEFDWRLGRYTKKDQVLSAMASLHKRGWLHDENEKLHITIPELPYDRSRPEGRYLKRKIISRRRKHEVHERDNWICWLCGYETILVREGNYTRMHDWTPSLDHVELHSEGGNDHVENLKTAHLYCNTLKGPNTSVSRTILKARVHVRLKAKSLLTEIPGIANYWTAWSLACDVLGNDSDGKNQYRKYLQQFYVFEEAA